MRFLASAVMQGKAQAVMVITVLAMLSLIFPPVSILSAAAMALVTLRQGWKDSATVLVLAGIACGLLAQLIFGVLLHAIGFVLLMWLPVVVLALLLRYSRSLAIAIQGGIILAAIGVMVQFFLTSDLIESWRPLLEPFSKALVEAKLLEADKQEIMVTTLAQWMPGILAAGILMQSLAGLLLARWWQAILYNPGGFKQEFHQLRLSKALALMTLLVVIARLLLEGHPGMLADAVMMVLLVGWFLQGLALAHGALGLLGVNSGWLVGIYVLLMFAMPHMVMVLSSAGFADVWFDFRARLTAGNRSA